MAVAVAHFVAFEVFDVVDGVGGVLATGNAYFVYRLSNAPYIYPNLVPPAVPGVTSVFWRMMENVFSVFGSGPASASNPSVANWDYFTT